ncbi:MAG: hypothetical protein AUG96_01075 [Chloroflexi bacterium 13_1_20CM_4_66_15]|nr:MAG: hypothetical protein AUG96_01075 [Chloroflexi bacterium 13_1_20CM_4_66_15]
MTAGPAGAGGPDSASRLVEEDLLHRNGVAFHAGDLGDAGDLALTVAHTRELHDQVDGRSHLLPDRLGRQIDACHEHHGFETRHGVASCIGMEGSQGAVVTGVHRLQHIQRLAGTALADHDPVRAHPEGVDDKLTDADLVLTVEVGRAGFHPADVLLVELQLGGVLDGDDALIGRDE